jgi:methylthioribulose-1-phosphate dehydratase
LAIELATALPGSPFDAPVPADEKPEAVAAPTVPEWAATEIVEAGKRMDALGWVRATAGNLSMRVADDRVAITRSGCHKGFLNADDVMLVDLAGRAVTPARSSAETLLHCQLYRMFPEIGAVLHGHSVAATVLTLTRHGSLVFSGYEVLKAFGFRSHEVEAVLPVFDNAQDIAELAERIAPTLEAGAPLGYALRGHGVYAWGPDMATARARLEALEFLLECELKRSELERGKR